MDLVIKMSGGLGNQMSQYAFGKFLKNMYSQSNILFHICCAEHNGFELTNIFPNVHIDYAQDENLHEFGIYKNRYISEIFKRFFSSHYIKQQYISKYPISDEIYHLNKDKNYYFDGTWHSCDYESIMNELYNDFTFKRLDNENQIIAEKIKKTNSVSIHVRRGDYVKLGLNICDKDYYTKAINIIENKVENPYYYIFSDDIDYANEFLSFINGDKYFITGNNGKNSFKDIQLMSYCKHNIIVNSTFSYWGALLNKNTNKIVIRPKMQTKDRETWDYHDFIKI